MEYESREHWRNEAVSFMALASVKGIGFWTLHKIAKSGISFKSVLKAASRDKFEKLLSINAQVDQDAWESYQQDLWDVGLDKTRELAKKGVNLFFNGQQGFPTKLSTIADAPYWIFIQGQPQNLFNNAVAIVGSRKVTDDGIFLTKLLVSALAYKDIVTVSGLASGIDQIAHVESIRYGIPTIAVLGTGINNDYPRGSEALRSEILKSGGTVISEYLPDQTYSAQTFVRRNRLQAALADTLVPTEWAIKSGTAHTVEFAHSYGKNISNVYLPGTYSKRSEIKFSEDNKGAYSYELPKELPEMVELISNGSPTPKSTNQIQIEL
jgi:DNA processing protein